MPPEEHATLELRDYLRVLRRRKWTVALTILVCLTASLVMALVEKPVYVERIVEKPVYIERSRVAGQRRTYRRPAK